MHKILFIITLSIYLITSALAFFDVSISDKIFNLWLVSFVIYLAYVGAKIGRSKYQAFIIPYALAMIYQFFEWPEYQMVGAIAINGLHLVLSALFLLEVIKEGKEYGRKNRLFLLVTGAASFVFGSELIILLGESVAHSFYALRLPSYVIIAFCIKSLIEKSFTYKLKKVEHLAPLLILIHLMFILSRLKNAFF